MPSKLGGIVFYKCIMKKNNDDLKITVADLFNSSGKSIVTDY